MSETAEAPRDGLLGAPGPDAQPEHPARTAETPAPDNPLTGAAEPETPPEPEPDADPAEVEREKRLAQMAYDRRAARREARQAQEELAALRARQPAPAQAQQPSTPAEIERMVEQRAAERVRVDAFNATCNGIFAAGTKEYPEFAKSVAAFQEIGGLPPMLVEAASEAGDAHKILQYLGTNIDEAERIAGLSPARMGAAVAKIAAKLAAAPVPKPVSKAPAPIKPIAGAARGTRDPDDLPIDEWMAMDRKRTAERARR